MKTSSPKICFDRIIPEKPDSETAKKRKQLEEKILSSSGKKNMREAFKDIDPAIVIPHPFMAIINLKTWGNGYHLKCRFLGGSPVQQQKVMQKAKIWEQYANIHIDFVDTNDAEIRIDFLSGQGSWSAIGKDALDVDYFPKDQPTMNFGWLEDGTDDDEYERVVVHEFGHALGCVHEHQAPTEHLRWNVEAVYKYFSGPPNNWDKATIDSNILEKYSPKGINATIFDRKSIMLYQFPAELFLDHIGTPENYELSEKDKAFIATIYPR